MTTTNAGFKVDGEGVTEILWDLVLEGRHEQAMQILSSSLPELSLAEANQILQGRLKLVGINTVELEPVEPDLVEKYDKQLAWLYAGTVHWKDSFWQPYAYVSAFSAEDVSFANRVGSRNRYSPGDSGNLFTHNKKLGYERCCYYMNDPVNDYATAGDVPNAGKTAVLWRQGARPPVFFQARMGFEEALADYFAAGKLLEERMPDALRYGRKKYTDATQEELPADDQEDNSQLLTASDGFITDMARISGLPLDQVQGLLGPGPFKAETALPELSKRGWIAPNGDFYPCLFSQHIRLAELLAPEAKNAVVELENKGWIQVAERSELLTEGSVVARHHPTPSQQTTLEAWAAGNGINLQETM